MTDEKMAEEYVDTILNKDDAELDKFLDENLGDLKLTEKQAGVLLGIIKGVVINSYLAGLKVGKDMNVSTKWHDLRKDPNDLPKDTYDVLDQAGYKVHYNFFQNVWVNEKDEIDEHVIAWCEIPTFDKE